MAIAPVQVHPKPGGPVIMYQSWRRLLFLHWDIDVPSVQATLPPGLTVDTWEGRAWIGVVPFKMEGVRPRFFPAVGGLSNFPELNVRTYVRDERGRPGVWFYSLDCAQPIAVWTARTFFRLPYFHARMQEEVGGGDGLIRYDCQRCGLKGEDADYEYRGVGEAARSGEETIEQFLIERYRLYAGEAANLLTGEVWHDPYLIQRAEVVRWSTTPLRQAGFDVGVRAPTHQVFAPGVDVRIFGVERV